MASQAERTALRTIIDVQQAIIDADFTPDAVMRAASQKCLEITPGTGAVVELKRDGELVYTVTAGGLSGTEGTTLPLENSLSGLAMTTGQPQYSPETETDDRVNREATRRVGARSMVVVPLTVDGIAVGVLKVVSSVSEAFDDDDVEILATVASFIARVLQHAQRFVERVREQALYQLISETTTDVVMQVELDGTICWASPSAKDLLGRSPEELVGMRNIDLVAAGFREEFARLVEQARATGSDTRWELPCDGPDGTIVWLESAGRLATNAAGEPLFRIVRLRDVTAERQEHESLRRSEALFRTTLANAPIAMCLVAPDGGFVQVNAALCSLFGRTPRELQTLTWQELTHAEDVAKDQALVVDVLEGRREKYQIVKRYLRPNGDIVWGDLSVSCVRDADGAVIHFISQIVDVTDTVHQMADAEQATEQYERIVSHGSDVLLQVDRDGSISWVSPNAKRLFGRPAEALLQTLPVDVVAPSHLERVAEVLDRMTTEPLEAAIEFPVRRPDGTQVWVEAVSQALTGHDGEFDGHVVRLRDISRVVEQRKRLQQLAITDPLTGLITRDEVERRLRALVGHPPRTGLRSLLAFVDVDGLKDVNDVHGHDAGDELLRVISRRMLAFLREGDVVSRIGGDELLLVLTGIRTVDDGLEVLSRLQTELARPHAYGDVTLHPRASIGVTEIHPGEDVEALMKRADEAMYTVKRAGGAGIRLATDR